MFSIAHHLIYLNVLFLNRFIDENMLETSHEKILSFHNFFSLSTIFFLAEFSLAFILSENENVACQTAAERLRGKCFWF